MIASFGIGTSLSNDFKSISSGRERKNKALNMVIKLHQVGGEFCAKISDELTKVRTQLHPPCVVTDGTPPEHGQPGSDQKGEKGFRNKCLVSPLGHIYGVGVQGESPE